MVFYLFKKFFSAKFFSQKLRAIFGNPLLFEPPREGGLCHHRGKVKKPCTVTAPVSERVRCPRLVSASGAESRGAATAERHPRGWSPSDNDSAGSHQGVQTRFSLKHEVGSFLLGFEFILGAAPSPPRKCHSCSPVGQSVSVDGSKSICSKTRLLHRTAGTGRTFRWGCLRGTGCISGWGWGWG